jgi:hypothetical protein
MSKLAEPFNFRYVKNYNVDKIVDIANLNKDEWFFEIPVDGVYSKYYAVFESSIYWKPEEEPFSVIQESDNQELIDLLAPIIKELEELHDGICGEVLITKLGPGSKIESHMDNGQYLFKVRRHHIPLTTSSNVVFLVGSEKVNMKVGECWEINNNRPHSVHNNGKEDRLHVIIDIMPNKEIGK